MVMVGPLTTIQGSKFIIGRLPVFIDRQLGGLDMRDQTIFPELKGEDHVPGKNFWGFTTVLFSWDIVVNQSRVSLNSIAGPPPFRSCSWFCCPMISFCLLRYP
jgi:hypothetical protein